MKVLLIAAMTADGYIARTSEHLSTAWTNEEDKFLFTSLVKEAGNMVMGYSTFLTTAQKSPSVFTKSMPNRRLLVYTHKPEAVASYPKVEAVDESPKELVQRLEKEGVQALAVCGGRQVYTMFMQAGVVDDIYIDMQATVFGVGVPLFGEEIEASIELNEVKQLGDNNVLLHYIVKK